MFDNSGYSAVKRFCIWLLAFELGPFACAPSVQKLALDDAHRAKPRVEQESVSQLRNRLLSEQDTDGDQRITVLDRPARPFSVQSQGGLLTFKTPEHLHNLLEVVTLALRAGSERVDYSRVFEDPVTHLSRNIRERFWQGLTRRIDPAHVAMALNDTKTRSSQAFLYVPGSDAHAWTAFTLAAERASEPKFQVRAVPPLPTPDWVRQLDGRHGLLSLALNSDGQGVPFVVPGGRFNELYGWDSYFHVLGLLQDGLFELARSIVDNFIYEIEHYGKVLNANRTYYLTRSQPPFFASMVLAVYDASVSNSIPLSVEWLRRALRAADKEYEQVWSTAPRVSPLCDGDVCLARYYGQGKGEPPEVEPGHFDWIYRRLAPKDADPARFAHRYRTGVQDNDELDVFFTHDRSMRESGHDTTYRWFDVERGYGRCADFVTVGLNALLLRYETDLARLSAIAGLDAPSVNWCDRAERRAKLMTTYLRDERSGLYFDYQFQPIAKRSDYLSATSLYVPWAARGKCGMLFDNEQLQAGANVALSELEAPGGLYATSPRSASQFQAACGREATTEGYRCRQWDYPHGWAPHQIIAWAALQRVGRLADAQRLAYRWLYTIVWNATRYAGTVPEKFDVLRRSHQVFAEYGNVGTDFTYITEEGFGWMNASFQIGLRLLNPELRQALSELVPPETLLERRILSPRREAALPPPL